MAAAFFTCAFTATLPSVTRTTVSRIFGGCVPAISGVASTRKMVPRTPATARAALTSKVESLPAMAFFTFAQTPPTRSFNDTLLRSCASNSARSTTSSLSGPSTTTLWSVRVNFTFPSGPVRKLSSSSMSAPCFSGCSAPPFGVRKAGPSTTVTVPTAASAGETERSARRSAVRITCRA